MGREREREESGRREGESGRNGESAPQFDSGHLTAAALAQTKPQFPH